MRPSRRCRSTPAEDWRRRLWALRGPQQGALVVVPANDY